MPAPLCRYCGTPIKKKTVTVYLRARALESHEASHGDYARYLQVDKLPVTIGECRKLTNYSVVSVKCTPDAKAISYFSEWDGQSYADKFFCTNNHAQKFGYAAAHSRMTTALYREALKKQESSTAVEAAKPGEDR